MSKSNKSAPVAAAPATKPAKAASKSKAAPVATPPATGKLAQSYVLGQYSPNKPARQAIWAAAQACIAQHGGSATGAQLIAAFATVPGITPTKALGYLLGKNSVGSYPLLPAPASK